MVADKENGHRADDEEEGRKELQHDGVEHRLERADELVHAVRQGTCETGDEEVVRMTDEVLKGARKEGRHHARLKIDVAVILHAPYRPARQIDERDDGDKAEKLRDNTLVRSVHCEQVEELFQV